MIFGMLAIWIAFFATLVSTGTYFRWMMIERKGELGGKKEREAAQAAEASLAPIARWGFVLSFAMLLLAILQIETAAYRHDFSLSYIARFSNREEPASYLFATLWAGQEGTFLLWCAYVTLMGLVVRRYAKHYEASVMFFLNLIRISFLIVLIGKSPFAPLPALLPAALQVEGISGFRQSLWAFFNPGGLNMANLPLDGQGLNPLLQNPWMRIHPPTLFLGFACTAIPFAYALAALWKKDYDGWVKRALPWSALAFTVLGTGIMMGGYWAYAILGWGGYWGWDPVENSSKIPWLLSVVLLHGMLMQTRRNMWHRATALFGMLPFLTVMYSSFLTRSGILQDFSVHSFAKEDDLFPYLIGPLTFFWVLSLGAWLYRWKSFPEHKGEIKTWSVPAFITRAVGLIGLFTFLVWVGTSSPLLTGIAAFVREKAPSLGFLPNATSNVSIDYYNFIATPIAIIGALLMAFVPYLNWRDTDLKKTWHKALTPFSLSIFVLSIAVFYGVGRDRPGFELIRWGAGDDALRLMLPAWIPLLSLIFAGAMALFTSLQTVILTPNKVGKLGGYLSHAGIGLLLIGVVASELSDRDQRVALVKGGLPEQVMGYSVRYHGLTTPTGKDAKPALDLTFTRGNETFKAPTPMYYSDYNQNYNYAPYIHKYAGHDLYVAPEGPPMSTTDMAKREVELKAGQIGELINGVRVRFVNFAVSGKAGETIRVGAEVDVQRDGQSERVVPYWEASPNQARQSIPVKTADGNVTVEIGDLNADTRAVKLVVGGHALGEPKGPPQEIALLSVSTKPMINLVWLATLLVMCGGLLSTRRAFADLGRAEARDRERYAEEDEETGGDGTEGAPQPKRRSHTGKEAVAGAHFAERPANP